MVHENSLKNLEKGKATQFHSGEEAAKNGSKGGTNAGISKRRASSMSELAKKIAAAPVSESNKKALKQMGLEEEDANNSAMVTASVYRQAIKGNMAAVDKWQQLTEDAETKSTSFYLPARLLGKAYVDINRNIAPNMEYVFAGGRGSLKSTFIGQKLVELLINHPDINACAVRKVSNTIKDSVYSSIKWSIMEMDLEDDFKFTVSPMEIIYKKTRQTIYFRGADDPAKLKSIKPLVGYIGILWFEEADQFHGDEELRNIQQSVLRGGNDMYLFKSFNPPKSRQNFMNEYAAKPKPNMIVHRSTYLEAPSEWLGDFFLNEAEILKEQNPAAYDNEYMGIATGTGGEVFDNLEIRQITDEEIMTFDNIVMGLDFGWFPDCAHWSKSCYNAHQRKLYVFDEFRANKMSNYDLWQNLVDKKGVTGSDLIIADSAEPKSIGDLRSYGALCRGAIKGPESRNYSYKWLQSLVKIVIDPIRCPATANEFQNCEYERTKDGEIISGYPQHEDHAIDSIRYSTNNIWRRKGQ